MTRIQHDASDDAPTVEVILAVRDGAAFLPALLDSLAGQARLPDRLLVHDDASHDASRALVERFAITAPFAVTVLPPLSGPVGPRDAFGRLLGASQAELVLLCDQDDVWHRTKIAAMARAWQRQARRHGREPLVLCHDLRLIDADDRQISPSFWRHQAYDVRRGRKPGRLLVMNCFPGCAMGVNRAAIDAALPVPPQAIMHDWWLALVGAACGRLVVLDRPLTDYRQHGANAIGVEPHGLAWWRWRRIRAARRIGGDGGLRGAGEQAAVLVRRHGAQLSPGHRRRIGAVVSAVRRSRTERYWHLLAAGVRKGGLRRHLAWLWECVRLPVRR